MIEWLDPAEHWPTPADEEYAVVVDHGGLISRGRLRLIDGEWIVIPPRGASLRLAGCTRWRRA